MTRKEKLEKTIDFDDAIHRIIRLEEENVELKEDENSVGMEYIKEQTCLDCKHCNFCYRQRHQGNNKVCDDIELIEW